MNVTDVTDTSAIQPLINQFDDYIKYDNEYHHSHEFKHFHRPTIAELDHFKKSWFYDDWCVRFRKLNAFNALGTKGVIAIPNTTFEEWLYWFQEWAIAWMDDYNQFKKMVYEALQLIEKHLEAIDKTLEDHEKRIEKIEDEIKDIYSKIQDIYNKIQDIYNKIADLQNQINNINNEINQINQEIKDLENKEQQDINNIKNEINGIKGLLGRYGTLHYIDFSDNQDGWEQNPESSVHGFGVMWAYLTDTNHSAGYQVWINIDRMIAKNVSINNLKPLTIDLTQVAPDIETRPMDVVPDYDLWLYSGYLGYASGTNVGASGNMHFHMTKIDSNHAQIHFQGMSGEYSNLSAQLTQLEVAKGKPNPIITYINPDM